MRLIGLLDSPYVRRVAISLQLLELEFEHEALSVFRHFDAFSKINPAVKAPTLVADDGTTLMESSLILQYAEELARPRTLLPQDPGALLRDLRVCGLALVACDRSVQIIYEHGLRPLEKHHQPWLDRVTGQLIAACGELEQSLSHTLHPASGMTQGTLTAAVAWNFMREMIPQVLPWTHFPRLEALSEFAEQLPAFEAAPHGEGPLRR